MPRAFIPQKTYYTVSSRIAFKEGQLYSGGLSQLFYFTREDKTALSLQICEFRTNLHNFLLFLCADYPPDALLWDMNTTSLL